MADNSIISPKIDIQDRSSVSAFHLRSDQLAREQQIANETMFLVGERLARCFRTEGVNHFVNCKELRERYWALCSDRTGGMLFPPGAEPVNRNKAGLKYDIPK